MFFRNKKQKKIDARVRFQAPEFRSRLQEAKGYKRTPRQLPDNPVASLLTSLGLGSWWMRIGVLLVLAGIVYVLYIPNFLYVKSVTVAGVNGEEQTKITNIVQDYLQTGSLLRPQTNLLFLQKSKLSDYVRNSDEKVWKVTNVKKTWPNKVAIEVVIKQDRYVVGTTTETVMVYNDGSVARQIAGDPVAFLNDTTPNTIKIKIAVTEPIELGSAYLDHDKLTEVVEQISRNFDAKTNAAIAYFEVPVLLSQPKPTEGADPSVEPVETTAQPVVNWRELTVHTKQDPKQQTTEPLGYRILFDVDSDIQDTLAKLGLLLYQMDPRQRNNLAYIDMRFKNRGFICLRGTVCAEPPKPVEPLPVVETSTVPTATSTQD